MGHRTTEQLNASAERVRGAPADAGELRMIVRRPASGEREVLTEAELGTEAGVVGDNWLERGSRKTDDGSAHPEMQLNIMNARVAELLADTDDERAMAGDQLYLDLDLTESNLPAGTRLALGDAVIEVTAEPHTGCAKFAERFGMDAARWVNSPVGKELRARGINAKVVQAGAIRVGDRARKQG